MVATVNTEFTFIPDEAEVWLALKSDVSNISSMVPNDANADLEAIGWEFCGYLDEKKGISLNPSIEVKKFNAFGHPKFRVKLKNGEVETGFTILEENAVTRKIVLPGSAANKIGAPKDVQIYVLYRVIDKDTADGVRVWVSLTPAPVETKDHSGFVDGELTNVGCVVHHTNDAVGDVFEIVSGAPVGSSATRDWQLAVTATGGSFTLSYGGESTAPITVSGISASTIKTALAALDDGFKSADWTITGASSPYAVKLPKAGVITVDATSATGGTVTVTAV